MGYKKEATLYRLKFQDPGFGGFECVMKSLTIKQFKKLASMSDELKSGAEGAEDALDNLFGTMAKKLVSWNLEDEDGNPVPATAEGIEDQELDFILQILMAWMDGVAGVTKGLGKDSNSGETSLEEQLQLASLSTSPVS